MFGFSFVVCVCVCVIKADQERIESRGACYTYFPSWTRREERARAKGSESLVKLPLRNGRRCVYECSE